MKKLFIFLTMLVLGIVSSWAQIEVSPSTGVYWKNGAETSDNYAPQWKSNAKATDGTTSLLVFTGETGMDTSTGDIFSNQTYTLEVPAGYIISGYTFNGTATNGDITITPSGASGTTITSGSKLDSPLAVTVRAQSTTFTLSGGNYITSLQLIVTISPIPVIIANDPNMPNTYGSFSGQTYTTGDASNMAGVTVTASTGLTIGEQNVNVGNYGKCFKLVTEAAATDYTVTMTAPEGYVITGYYLGCSANTKDAVHTLTSEDGSVSVVASAPPYNNPVGRKVFEVTGLNTNSTHFTINTANNGNTLYLPKFYIYIAKSGEVVNDTYKVIFNGKKVDEGTSVARIMGFNTTPAIPAGLPKDYCTYEYYSDEACTTPLSMLTGSATTVYAKCTCAYPFTLSSSFETATWYNLKLYNSRYPTYVSSGNPNVTLPDVNAVDATTLWAFFGDPHTGIQLVNYAAGTGKVLGSASPANDGNTGANTHATMNTSGTQVFERWFPKSSTHYTNGFYLFNSEGYALNYRSANNLAYWTTGYAAGSTFCVEEVTMIMISNATGTYYTEGGAAIDPTAESGYWGPTWKSTRTINDKNLLTLTTSIGMNSKNSNIYTGAEGAIVRYTLTAATGYVIAGYSIVGTANSTNITITPRIRKNLTITNGQSGKLSVADLDLKTTSFTLSGANSTQGNLSSVTLCVMLKPTANVSYTPPVTNNTTAAIGYKHIGTSATRNMTYMTKDAAGVVSPNKVSTTFDEAPSTVAEFTFEYDSNIRAYYIKETSTNKYVYAKDDLTWADGSRNTTTNVAALGVENLPGDDEGKTLFQWLIYNGGTSVNQPSYYIRPKCNTNTAVSVQSMDAGILGFYDIASKNYDFAHASLLTWEQLVTLYYNSARETNVLKAGTEYGYPKTTSTEYTTLRNLLQTFTGGHTYTKSDYTSLISYYNAYVSTNDLVVAPVVGDFLRIKASDTNKSAWSLSGSNLYLTSSNCASKTDRAGFAEGSATDNTTIFYYDGKTLIGLANGLQPYKNKDNQMQIGTAGTNPTDVKFESINSTEPLAFRVEFNNNGRSLYTQRGGSAGSYYYHTDAAGGNATDYHYRYFLEKVTSIPVTFKNTGLGYATFYTPVALQITDSKTHAYVCKRNNNTLTFYEITNITTKNGNNDVRTIPANTAVLLYNEDAKDATTVVNFPITTCKDEEGNDIRITNNSFAGTLAAETVAAFKTVEGQTYDIYSLRTSNNGAYIGFYSRTSDSPLAGFKAWLRVDTSGARNFTIVFEGESDPTGIVEALGLENENVEIYDLNGRKLSSYKKGINIVNGKKVMIQ